MKKILIVDDLDTNRELLKKMIAKIGDYEFVEAEDGTKALTAYQESKPDLILMDINMPEMDGYQAAGAIKSLMGDNFSPIIFVTAMSSVSHLKEALASGGDDFICKPYNFSILESKIKAHLRIRELNLQLHLKNKELKIYNQHLLHEQDLINHFFDKAIQSSYFDPEIIQYHMSAMSAFNGDLLLAAKSQSGDTFLIVGDFTGHGLGAAMGTLPVAMVFFKMVKKGLTVSEMVREINKHMHNLMPAEMFCAATLVRLKQSGREVECWTGGLPESYWLGEEGELKGELHSKHMALGILTDNEFDDRTETFEVQQGDRFYLYSDGVIEATDSEGNMYGEQRFKDSLLQHKENRFDRVMDELHEYSGTSDQTDDITLVELICKET